MDYETSTPQKSLTKKEKHQKNPMAFDFGVQLENGKGGIVRMYKTNNGWRDYWVEYNDPDDFVLGYSVGSNEYFNYENKNHLMDWLKCDFSSVEFIRHHTEMPIREKIVVT